MVQALRFYFFLFLIAIACDDTSNPIPPDPDKPDTTEQQAPVDSIPNDTIPNDTLEDEIPPSNAYYFPPSDSHEWETITPQSLGWNSDSLQRLLDFASKKNTYGFIILYKGRIVTENYWNNWDTDSRYPIASAGKSITAFLLGIAQQEGKLDISKRTSDYLGSGWTSSPREKEDQITIAHQLSMTSGLNEQHDACSEPSCLEYVADAGTRWAYHNAAYNLLHSVLEHATNESLNDYTRTRLAEKIGMTNSAWDHNILSLSTRDMARFGLLVLHAGAWKGEKVLNDANYFNAMIASSSVHNKSYGYLWWLNGKNSHRIPGDENLHDGPLVQHAPADMFAAMGKGDKKIYVVPSLHLVVVRHGDDTGEQTFGPSSFDSELWKRLQSVIGFEL